MNVKKLNNTILSYHLKGYFIRKSRYYININDDLQIINLLTSVIITNTLKRKFHKQRLWPNNRNLETIEFNNGFLYVKTMLYQV